MNFKYSDNFRNKDSFLEEKRNYDFITEVLRLMALFWDWWHCSEADGTVLSLMALFWAWWYCSETDGTVLRLVALFWGWWHCSEADGTVLRPMALFWGWWHCSEPDGTVLRLMTLFSLQIIITLLGKTSTCIIVGCKCAYGANDTSRR
jgi:hypothetical protein